MRPLPRRLTLVAALAPVVALGLPANSYGVPMRTGAVNHLPGDGLRTAPVTATASAVRLNNFRLIGHNNLGDFRDYADVWGHGDAAYVGTRCGERGNGGAGVKVLDISDPTRPRIVSTLPNPRYSRAEDVVVHHVETRFFKGELALVGIQQCFQALDEGHAAQYTGLQFFDVTHPARPVLLGAWKLPHTSRADEFPAIGCHEIDLVQRPGGRVLAGCARNLIDQAFNNSAGVHFVDASNPRNPQQVSQFSLPADPFSTGVGCFKATFDHSVRFVNGGRTAYLSYWDAGTVRLDLAEPARPRVVAKVKITPPDEDGDNHSMTLANGGKWLVINPEDFSPFDRPCKKFDGYGEAYVYDNTNPARPRYLGSFATPSTHSTRTDGAFTVHNTEVVQGRQFFSSWYSDGIVWWTMRDNGASYMKGQFVPPANQYGSPLVWGVYPDSRHDVILASDFTSGLWIVKPVGLGNF